MDHDVLLVAVGCLTGVFAGMLGAGGGFATVVLLLAAGANPHVAVGTSLVYLMIMGGWGTFVHLRIRTVDRRLVVAIGLAAAAAALVGAEVAERLRNRDLALALGLFTASVSGVSLAWPQPRRPMSMPKRSVRSEQPRAARAAVPSETANPALTGVDDPEPAEAPPAPVIGRVEMTGAALGGVAIGGLKGLFGVGAGFLIVPLMVTAGRVPRKLAVGSSLFAILVASVIATLRHAMLDNVDGMALLWLVPGGLFGSFVGARAAHGMSPAAIRRVFLGMMAGSTIYLLVLAASYE